MSWKNILKVRDRGNPFIMTKPCPTPHKIKYPDKGAAIRASKQHRGRKMKPYQCAVYGDHWHLTSAGDNPFGPEKRDHWSGLRKSLISSANIAIEEGGRNPDEKKTIEMLKVAVAFNDLGAIESLLDSLPQDPR